jgi:hypothetical protein
MTNNAGDHKLRQMTKTSSERVYNVVRKDQRKCIEILTEVEISGGSVHSIVQKDMNMHYLSQRLVPKMLIPGKKETRCDGSGASAAFPGLTQPDFFLFPRQKVF